MNDTNDERDQTRPLSFYDHADPGEVGPDEATPGSAPDEAAHEEPAYDEPAYDEPGRRTHPLSVGHLVCGLVFLGIAASWALRQLGVIESDGQQWVLPLVLVVAGGAGLLALVAKGMFGRKA